MREAGRPLAGTVRPSRVIVPPESQHPKFESFRRKRGGKPMLNQAGRYVVDLGNADLVDDFASLVRKFRGCLLGRCSFVTEQLNLEGLVSHNGSHNGRVQQTSVASSRCPAFVCFLSFQPTR